MNIEVKKSKTARGKFDVLVAGTKWGRFEMFNHGPQGNSYILFQEGGMSVRDPGHRQSLKVYGDKMTARLTVDRSWHRTEISVEERLHIAAQYAVAKTLLRHPDAIKAEADEKRAQYLLEIDAEVARRRQRDVDVAMGIIGTFAMSGGDIDPLQLANAIADAIEAGRSQ